MSSFWRSAFASVLFATAVSFFGSLLVIHVTLYATNGCPPNYCYPTAVVLPIVPLLLGIALALVVPRPSGDPPSNVVLRGLCVGFAASLIVALMSAAAIPFHDPYFTLPYRAYALAYVGAASFLVAWWSSSKARRDPSSAARAALPLLCVIVGGVVSSILARDLAVAAAASVGAVAGGAAATMRIRPDLSRITHRHVLLTIAVVAVVVRLFFGLQTLIRTGPGMAFAVASDDGDSYFTLASKLADGPSGLGDILSAIAFPPGYSLFVGAILVVARGSLAAVVIVQALLAGLATVLLYLIVARFAGARVALVAAFLYALDQNLIQNQSTLTAEALLLPLTLGALWALIRYRATRRLRWLCAGAAALGLIFITRNLVAIPLIAAAVIWMMAWHGLRTWSLPRDVAVLAFAVVLAISPIALATGIREGTPRVTTQLAALAWEFEGAEGMTIGNGPLLARDIRPFTDPFGSLRRVLADPLPVAGFFVVAVPQRLSTLLFFPASGYSDPILIANPATHPNQFGELIGLIRAIALVVGLIASAAWWSSRHDPDVMLLALYALLYLAAFSFLFPPYHPFRYRIPIEPLRFAAESIGLIVMARFAARAWVPRERPDRRADAVTASAQTSA